MHKVFTIENAFDTIETEKNNKNIHLTKKTMKKITQETIKAFLESRPLKMGNTQTDGYNLWLHGNKIIKKDITQKNSPIFICLQGWNTQTTKERLNGLPNVKVSTKQGQVYLNGEKWDGECVKIK